ncbi:hypothetical protein CBR_g50813 [Chara braunii]|uniref:Uncharacterized protein n=1 Tax=Chara braunii TaxID=69332 RepID=A0A388M798_CHABU|nr:hypothetical protein CBR_g50813 [Chara braunii]|eukprot:GBG90467.1 hypothetical protein CBR_g50813 [Chara braunii]
MKTLKRLWKVIKRSEGGEGKTTGKQPAQSLSSPVPTSPGDSFRTVEACSGGKTIGKQPALSQSSEVQTNLGDSSLQLQVGSDKKGDSICPLQVGSREKGDSSCPPEVSSGEKGGSSCPVEVCSDEKVDSSRPLEVPSSDEKDYVKAPPRIAIDLGTSSCRVAVCRDGKVQVIPDVSERRSTPSVIAFTDEKCLVGEQAQKQLLLRKPENLLYEARRLIGRDYDAITETERKWWPFIIVKGESGEAMLDVKTELLSSLMRDSEDELKKLSSSMHYFLVEQRGVPEFKEGSTADLENRYLAPEQVLAVFLAKMKSDAETFLECGELHSAVIAVPALYLDRQRSAIKVAAEIAGFTDVQLVSESTSAALSYAQHKGLVTSCCSGVSPEEQTQSGTKMLVVAMGGGNCEAAMVTITGGELRVNSAAGNPSLGGMDFDHKMMELVLNRVQQQFNRTLPLSSSTLRELKTASEKAKKDLTLMTDTQVGAESFGGDDDRKVIIGRGEYEEHCKSLLEECMKYVQRVLAESKTPISLVKEVVLVGGSTRIPKVVDMLWTHLDLEPKPHPYQDEAVVRGAALFADCSEQVIETHPIVIACRGERNGAYQHIYEHGVRPTCFALPIREGRQWWGLSLEYRVHDLDIHEGTRGDTLSYRPTGIVSMTEEKKKRFSGREMMKIDRCGIMGLDEESVPKLAAFYKIGQRPPPVVDSWKKLAKELPVHERRIAEMSARSQWKKYSNEVEKRESACPRWLWNIICEWKRDIEGWPGNEAERECVGISELTSRFAEFRKACEYAFGATRARPTSGRKFLVVDCWKSKDIENCAYNLFVSRGPELCEMVISMPLKDLLKTKERFAEMEGLEGIGLAAPGLSLKATPNALTKDGIPYVLLEAGPAVTSSGDPENLCSGWNKFVGEQVSLALQAGLQVVLRLGRDHSDDMQIQNEAFEREKEKRNCEMQLRDIVGRIGKNFRNIAIAYLPPSHVPLSETRAVAAEAARVAPCDLVVEVVRHIRRVIGDLVNAEAADATRILIGGCETADTWHALLSGQHAIDGFLLEAGLRDPLLFDKLLLSGGPSGQIRQERGGKVLLCGGQEENVTLSEYDMVWLSAETRKLMGTEEVLWITTKYVLTEEGSSETNMTSEIDGSYVLRWKKGHIMTDYRGEAREARKVTIVPIFDSQNNSQGQEPAEGLSMQLSALREKLARQAFSEWPHLLLEYRPAYGVESVDSTHSLLATVDRAHVLLRRWVLANLGAEPAQDVRIVCFLKEGLASDTRRQIANLPNVDGITLRLPARRTVSRTSVAA